MSPKVPGFVTLHMGITLVTSSASHDRIAFGQDWLIERRPAEELLIIGPTLTASNEIARKVTKSKGASFGYHRMTLAQLASTLARPTLVAKNLILSFPKIISARNYGATQIGLVWWRWFRIAARPVVAAHPCPIPGVCEFRCNRTNIM